MILGKIYTPSGYGYLGKELGTGDSYLNSPHLASATLNEEMVDDDQSPVRDKACKHGDGWPVLVQE